MKVITTNLLNRFWKKGVEPIKDALMGEINKLNENISSHKSSGDHDGRYYTETEVNNLLNGKAAAAHAHDDRYYTETEVNNLLNGKASSSHTHNYANASHSHDDRYYTETEVTNLLNGKASSSHTHNYANASHSHDDRYYTKSQINDLIWNEIVVEEKTVDNVNLAVGPYTQEINIAKSGYWIVGIVSADVTNATDGGSLSSQCPIYGFGHYGQKTGFIRVRCYQAAKVRFAIKVLYWKDPR